MLLRTDPKCSYENLGQICRIQVMREQNIGIYKEIDMDLWYSPKYGYKYRS